MLAEPTTAPTLIAIEFTNEFEVDDTPLSRRWLNHAQDMAEQMGLRPRIIFRETPEHLPDHIALKVTGRYQENVNAFWVWVRTREDT